MPLARTPPRLAGGGTSRAHTFSPSQAYPEGNAPPVPEAAPARGHGPPRTPPTETTPQPEPPATLPEKDGDDHRDDVDEVEEEPRRERRALATTRVAPDEEPEEGSAKEEEEDGEDRSGLQENLGGDGEEDESDVGMDVDVHPPPGTPPMQASCALSQPAVTPGRTPRAPRASYHPTDPLSPDDPSESTPRTPRTPRDRRLSRARTPAEVISEPPVPIRDTDEAEYGKYYETLCRALRINTIDKGLSKLT